MSIVLTVLSTAWWFMLKMKIVLFPKLEVARRCFALSVGGPKTSVPSNVLD